MALLEKHRGAKPFLVHGGWQEDVTIEIPVLPNGLGAPRFVSIRPVAVDDGQGF